MDRKNNGGWLKSLAIINVVLIVTSAFAAISTNLAFSPQLVSAEGENFDYASITIAIATSNGPRLRI